MQFYSIFRGYEEKVSPQPEGGVRILNSITQFLLVKKTYKIWSYHILVEEICVKPGFLAH